MMQIGQSTYSEPQGQQPGGKHDDGVVDGEYTVE